jgi:hypothetical protein
MEWCIAATPLQLQIRIERQQRSVEYANNPKNVRQIDQDALDIFRYALANYPVSAENYHKAFNP